MTTHFHLGGVAIAETNEKLIELLLQPREERLRRRPPKSKYAHQLRRDLRAGKSKPIQMLLAVMAADLEDGVPVAVLERFVDEFRNSLRKMAGLGATSNTKTLRALLLNEARAEGARNLIEIELHADPNNPALIERFSKATKDYKTANDALCAEVEARAQTIADAYHPATRQGTQRREVLVS